MNQSRETTASTVSRKSKSSDAQGLAETMQSFDPTFPSVESQYSKSEDLSSGRVDIPVKIGNKVPKGYR